MYDKLKWPNYTFEVCEQMWRTDVESVEIYMVYDCIR